MYSHLIASTGWTWEYIDQHMTLPRLDAMNQYWLSHPPLHLMVAAYLGIKPQPKKRAQNSASASANTEQDLQDFIQSFSAAGGSVG